MAALCSLSLYSTGKDGSNGVPRWFTSTWTFPSGFHSICHPDELALEGDSFTNRSEPHPILLDPIGCRPLSGQGLVHNQARPSIRPWRPAMLSALIMFQKQLELTTHLGQTVGKNQTAWKFNSVTQGGRHSL